MQPLWGGPDPAQTMTATAAKAKIRHPGGGGGAMGGGGMVTRSSFGALTRHG